MWDVFICHASEDKEALVRPLAKQLEEVYKVKVWYDEFTLEPGDSLLESIEKGLQESHFGVVVLSESFFDKQWTNHEYTSLRTKEMLLSKKVIIPIWHKIDQVKVASYSLTLADKYAISINDGNSIDDLAIKIIKIVSSDIYDNISRMHYFEQLVKNSLKSTISRDEILNIPAPPIRHEKLSIKMEARLRLVHNTIKDVDERNYEEYEKDFRRSTNIDREMIITELLTAAYLDCISLREMSLEEKRYVYIFMLSLANSESNLPIDKKEFSIFKEILNKYIQDINADVVAEYRFDK